MRSRRDSGDKISSRYDTNIVYALDENLTRGPFAVFARWLNRFLHDEDFPGSLVIVSFCAASKKQLRETAANSERVRHTDLGGVMPVPCVDLDSSAEHAILELKYRLAMPAVVILVALPTSPIQRYLACDGVILVQSRTMRQNMVDASEVLHQLNRYFLRRIYDALACGGRNDDDDDENESDIESGAGGECAVDYEEDENGEANAAADDDDDEKDDDCETDFCGGGGGGGETGEVRFESSDDYTARVDSSCFTAANDRNEFLLSYAQRQHSPPEHHIEGTMDLSGEGAGPSDYNGGGRSTRITILPSVNGSDASPIVTAAVAVADDENLPPRDRNDRIISQLRQMDRFFTETRPNGVVPVVHGEMLNLSIDASKMFQP